MFGGDDNWPILQHGGQGVSLCLVHLAAYYFIISDSSVTSQLLVSGSNEIALKAVILDLSD
jgi:hypothetical protein